jgi:hypothetical protein
MCTNQSTPSHINETLSPIVAKLATIVDWLLIVAMATSPVPAVLV